jgi:hypothetical protein
VTAPPGFAATCELAVPAPYAFEFLADPTTATIIDPAIREYRPDALPMGLGTRNRIRMRVWGVPVRAESEVTAWEPGALMVMSSVRPTRPFAVVATHRFEPVADDRCRYTWAVSAVSGALGRPAARAFVRFMRTNAEAQQIRFAAEVERRWRGGTTT